MNHDLNALSESVTLRPKFLGQNLVNDRHGHAPGLRRLSLIERAAPQNWQADGVEVVPANAVPGCVEGEAFGGSRRLRIGRDLQTGSLHILAQGDHPKWDRGGNAGMFDPWQRREAFLQAAVKVLGAFWFVAGQARIGFDDKTGPGLKAGVDRGGFGRPTDEQSGGSEKGERESDLDDDEWIARHKFPSAPNHVLTRLFLQVGHHCAARKLERRPQGKTDGSQDAKTESRGQDGGIRPAEPNNVERQHFPQGGDEKVGRPKAQHESASASQQR